MTGLFKRMRGSLGEHSHSYVPSIQTFLEVDVNKVKRELKLEDEGHRRGKNNQPASDSTALDEVERQVTTRVCLVSALVGQIGLVEEGRISGSS